MNRSLGDFSKCNFHDMPLQKVIIDLQNNRIQLHVNYLNEDYDEDYILVKIQYSIISDLSFSDDLSHIESDLDILSIENNETNGVFKVEVLLDCGHAKPVWSISFNCKQIEYFLD